MRVCERVMWACEHVRVCMWMCGVGMCVRALVCMHYSCLLFLIQRSLCHKLPLALFIFQAFLILLLLGFFLFARFLFIFALFVFALFLFTLFLFALFLFALFLLTLCW